MKSTALAKAPKKEPDFTKTTKKNSPNSEEYTVSDI